MDDRVRQRGGVSRLRLVFSALLIMAAVPNAVDAQCVIFPLKHKASRDIVAAFVGSLQEIQTVAVGQILTFTVSRVYKGQIDERVVIYFQKPQSRGGPEGTFFSFERGRDYLVLAHRLSPQERDQLTFSPEDGEKLGVSQCHAHEASSPYVRQVLGPTRGYAPRQRPR